MDTERWDVRGWPRAERLLKGGPREVRSWHLSLSLVPLPGGWGRSRVILGILGT